MVVCEGILEGRLVPYLIVIPFSISTENQSPLQFFKVTLNHFSFISYSVLIVTLLSGLIFYNYK